MISKDTESPVIAVRNEFVAAELLIYLNCGNDKEPEQHYIVANI